MKKIPEITLLFWIMKICATTLGETAGDQLAQTMKVGYAVSSLILIGFFLATLVGQLAAKRYIPALYFDIDIVKAYSTDGPALLAARPE